MKKIIFILIGFVVFGVGCKTVRTNKSVMQTHIDSVANNNTIQHDVSHVDSNNATQQKQVIQEKKKETDVTNVDLKFAKDSVRHSSPIIISTDTAGNIKIDIGDRNLTDLTATTKKSKSFNNTNATTQSHNAALIKSDSAGINKSNTVNVNKTSDTVIKNKSKTKVSIIQIIALCALIVGAIIAWKNRSKILGFIKSFI